MILPRKERRYLRSAKSRKAFDWISRVIEMDNPNLRNSVATTWAVVGDERPELSLCEQLAETRKRLRRVFEQTHPVRLSPAARGHFADIQQQVKRV